MGEEHSLKTSGYFSLGRICLPEFSRQDESGKE